PRPVPCTPEPRTCPASTSNTPIRARPNRSARRWKASPPSCRSGTACPAAGRATRWPWAARGSTGGSRCSPARSGSRPNWASCSRRSRAWSRPRSAACSRKSSTEDHAAFAVRPGHWRVVPTREDPAMTAENRHREIHSAADIQAQAGRFAREPADSAQQVWLAEEGRAVGEGQDASSASAAARLESLRQALDGALGRVTAKANEAWDSVGRSFEHRVQQALRQMDVPTREDFDALGARIDALTRELRLRTAAQPEPVVPPAPTAGNIHTHPDANIG